MSTPAVITGMGMMTPIGDCAAQTASSVRAGICRYRESSIMNRRFRPMTLALLPDEALPALAEGLADRGLTTRQARMLRLAGPALREACESLEERVPLFLATPEPHGDRPAPFEAGSLELLAIQAGECGARIDRDASRVFPLGRAGGLHALAAALEALAAGAPAVLVGGVDSHLDLHLLGTLDLEERVLAEGVMDGFCPGEGAAFLLLRPAEGGASGCLVHPPGLASETGHRYSSEPHRGEALAEALRAALAALGGKPAHTVLASLNGESFGAKEWGVAVLRNRAGLADPFRLEHPAEGYGDAGAATAPLLLGIAAIGLRRGWLEGPALAWCSSERESRGAACVTLLTNGGA